MPQPLALSPALRSWSKLGLDCLLLDSPERVKALRRPAEVKETARPAQGRPQFRSQARPAAQAGQTGGGVNTRFRRPAPPQQQRPAPRPQQAVQPPLQPRYQAQSQQQYQPQQPYQHINLQLKAAQGHVLPPEAWPPAWQELLKRRMPPHPLVCWTYAGLGSDLAGTPDPHRRELLARMIKGLAHPSGTHVFWPFELPGIETAEAEASLFWSGEALLHPRALLIMGSDARDALGLPKIGPYCQKFEQGRLIIQLPRPQSLVEKQDAFGQAMAFLSGLLRFCNKTRR